ncbi:MAG: ABC transporter ATP-binding protein, partial [Candidatus Aminicenantes bacterium]|nr:ABC transporter ATP-binding protein [Candidatus Aminicenantes bacterium]
MNNLLSVRNLAKDYPLAKGFYPVFRGLEFEAGRGEVVGIMGVSGVGKSTLLNLLGAIDRPTEGRIFLDGQDVFALPPEARARFRNTKIGFVFQFFHLLPEFTALENVCFPLLIRGIPAAEARPRAARLLEEVFLEDKSDKIPSQMSGGEQQRVAIARAIAKQPDVLLCDEPTGALDISTGVVVLEALSRVNLDLGTTVAL